MKVLVVYYSRTGTTRKIANEFAGTFELVIEEIKDLVDRSGAKGYMIAGRDATLRTLTPIGPIKNDPADFDLVIVGSPIWAWNIASPVRTYLEQNKFKFKRLAFFFTMGNNGIERALKEVGQVIGYSINAALALTTKEVLQNNYESKFKAFLNSLK